MLYVSHMRTTGESDYALIDWDHWEKTYLDTWNDLYTTISGLPVVRAHQTAFTSATFAFVLIPASEPDVMRSREGSRGHDG